MSPWRHTSRGREYLVEFEQGEELYLVTCDHKTKELYPNCENRKPERCRESDGWTNSV